MVAWALLLRGVPQGSGIFLAIEKSCQGPSECLKILFYFHTQYMDAACLAFCSKFSPQILLGIHCGSQYACAYVCVCVRIVAFCCATKLSHTHTQAQTQKEVHTHTHPYTRVYIYFNLMPWAIYYCADIIQTQWQWQWRGASSSSSYTACALLCSLNAERRRENGKWRMSLYVRIYGSCFSGALSRKLSTPHWARLDWRWLSTSSSGKSAWAGSGRWLGDTRTGILFSKRVWGRGPSGIGSTSVCLRWGFDKMIINAFLIIVMVSRTARNRITFPIAIFYVAL